MAKVKVLLDPGESPAQAEETLWKAMSLHRDGSAHEEEAFLDPAMSHQADLMVGVYDRILDKMMAEIQDVIDQEEA